ncbi:nuclear pore protein [Scheffersomyces xylosifermentans]|uniref:nuclear pore protein n=1 Tax=Scheffersomyces xylosifermentans TaxID=1304137 RepID=UPI00315C6D4B
MPDIGTKDQFVEQITSQSIFRTFVELEASDDSSFSTEGFDRLVCRNNTEVFFANRNSVRCCTISPFSTNYRLLQNDFDRFYIQGLEINPSGTLLAAIGSGDSELVLFSLPETLDDSRSLVASKSFPIKNIGGKIRKVVFQSVVANDCVVVILNDKNEIKAYDISISLEIPQISLKLTDFDQFKNTDQASSIAFGSSCNLSGSLTLYVTAGSKIHAIYPFVHKNAKIATTKERIDEAIEETTILLKTIEEKFPAKSIVESLESTLKSSAIKQFEYYSFLKRQVGGSVPVRTEVRGIHTKNPYELLVLDQNLPSIFTPQLQGPVFAGAAPIYEIIPLAANDHVSILTSASLTPSNNVLLTYHAQLKSLLMKWKNPRDEESVAKFPLQIKEAPPKGYTKPKRGFGFVDLDESEDTKKKSKTAEQLQYEQNMKEVRFWGSELSKLSVLGIDELPISSNEKRLRMRALDSNSGKIAVTNGAITVGDASAWINTLIESIVLGNQSPFEADTKYITSSSRKESILGLTSVVDTVTETGEYLIVFRRGPKDNLEVIELHPAEEKQKENLIESGTHEEIKHDDPPVLLHEPIDELLKDAKKLKRFPTPLGAGLSSDHLKKISGVESLVDVNKLSTTTIERVSEYTRYTININARVASQIEILKSQVETMRKISETKMDEAKLNENESKLRRISQKQEKLDQRVDTLKTKLFNSVQKLKANKSLPMSTAEKAWFREINSINNQVNKDSKERKSLVNVVTSLQAQVKEIIERHSEDKEVDASTKLRNMELRQQLAKVKYWLEQEDTRISSTKSELEDTFKRLTLA